MATYGITRTRPPFGRLQFAHHSPHAQRLPTTSNRRVHDLLLPQQAPPFPQAEIPCRRAMPITAKPPLSILPLGALLRSYAVSGVSSYNILLTPSLRILSYLANSRSPLTNLDRNPLIHILFKKTFYKQYCAGETPEEVRETIRQLKDLGFQGVMLAYGKEIVLKKGDKLQRTRSSISTAGPNSKGGEQSSIEDWKIGLFKTVNLTSAGDYVALKFSGAGQDVMRQLAARELPGAQIDRATNEICDLARSRGVRLLFDAEQQAIQNGIDDWTLHFQQKYNRDYAVVFGTYQAYLRSSPETVKRHLHAAWSQNFVLGVKLVRGAYMASDERSHFWELKDETDKAFDGIAEALCTRQWNSVLKSPTVESGFPKVELVMATHNSTSIERCLSSQANQSKERSHATTISFGQLMGMADEVSCRLISAGGSSDKMPIKSRQSASTPSTYKYLVWGSVGECAKYLVRRAEENRDAALRAKETYIALRREIFRRLGLFGSE